MRKKMIVICAIVIFCGSCGDNKSVDKSSFQGTTIKIEPAYNVKIEDFIEDYDTIRLEVSDNSIIGDIFDMQIMNDKYYILDDKCSAVYVFSQDGSFINKIKNQGQGPNEYIKINSFKVDYLNNRIVLADSFSKRIFVYNENGEQEKVIQLKFDPSKIVAYKNGFINFYSGTKELYTNPSMENYNLHILDSLGNFVSSAILNETKQRVDIGSMLAVNCLSNGDILYQPLLGDTIYKITEDKIEPFYTFNNLSKYKRLTKADKKEFQFVHGNNTYIKKMESKNYLLSWGEILDLEDYVFTPFAGWDTKIYLYYSKKQNKSILVVPDKVGGNDALKQIFMNYPRTAQGNKFYISPNIHQLIDLKKSLPDGKLKSFIENMDYDSNPAIITFSIKFPQS
jgi:hypothetical protein